MSETEIQELALELFKEYFPGEDIDWKNEGFHLQQKFIRMAKKAIEILKHK